MSSSTNYHYLLTDQKADEDILHEFPQGKRVTEKPNSSPFKVSQWKSNRSQSHCGSRLHGGRTLGSVHIAV